MAKSKITKKVEKYVETIVSENLEDIIGERFGRYSKYIIQDRALPDARDGLKPVQRRILFAMYKLGMFSNKPYKKSARIVGEVIGKYHPHGDSSVYDAMVRLSQSFKTQLPLIDMHGNNGSIDGDPPAAMRYTEARLSKYAEFLLKDINKKTVTLVPNFDDEEYEPTALPAKFPNLLANGSSGISAGYATEIPPHNIDELINATIYRIDHPDCSVKDIMKIVKGPDFPTGGIIQGKNEIIKAYKTGRGKIVVKAKTEIVNKKKFNQLVITEIPYDVNKANLVKRMNDVYLSKNIDGIIEIRDETDREGLRIVVDIKNDINPEYIRDFFYKHTDLQINYNFNMVAISEKRPKLMGILELLDAYIAHQKEVITNRSNYELSTAKRRLHIVEGLISMTSILDSVIKTIRSSENKKDAKSNLISLYSFSEIQAEAIVMLQLYRLTNTDIVALEAEQKNLKESIAYLEDILANETTLLKVIKKELKETLKNISTPRKSIIEDEIDDLVIEVKDLLPKEDNFIIVTHDGYIKRMTPRSYKAEETTKLKDDDVVTGIYEVTTADVLLLFTDMGNYVYLPIRKIPEVKHKDLGYNVSTLANIDANEKVIYTIPIDDFDKERYFVFTTKNGLIKRTKLDSMKAVRYSNALKATKIREHDKLVSVDICNDDETEVVVITKQGYINRYDVTEISIMAPASFGVKAIELKSRPNDEVVAGKCIKQDDIVVLLTQRNALKRLRPNEIIKGRKNNVGKQYMQMTKTISNDVIFADVIRHENANRKLDCYIYGTDGYMKVEYPDIMQATANTGKKFSTNKIGDPIKLIITRNNDDFN
ncbi:MAG TPA: DNA topoisomerase IV subunit A [Acholeplasmataceae bacterium]|nr:DNA topoisomerase IV subunit A [Acholeplasmataceae bacterium]